MEDAEITYAIKYGSNYMYIDKNKHQNVTADVHVAQKFESREKATNAIINIKKAYKKYDWDIIEVLPKNKVKKKEKNNKSKYVIPTTIFEKDDFSWNDTIHKLETFCKELEKYQENLSHRQSIIDRKISDIKHSVQLNKKDIDVTLLKELWNEERYVKDELLRIRIIMQSNPSKILSGKLSSSFLGMEYRQYDPRELPELFVV